MEEKFTSSRRECRRWTLDGVPVKVETREESAAYRRKPIMAKVTVWRGEHMLFDGENEWRVTRSETWNGGPLGLTLTYSVQARTAASERCENRRHLKAVIEQLFPGYTLADSRGAEEKR